MSDERLQQLRWLYFGNRFDESLAEMVYRHEADAVLREIIRLRALLAALKEPITCLDDYIDECTWCLAKAETWRDGVQHAPDCPWLPVLAERERGGE